MVPREARARKRSGLFAWGDPRDVFFVIHHESRIEVEHLASNHKMQ